MNVKKHKNTYESLAAVYIYTHKYFTRKKFSKKR